MNKEIWNVHQAQKNSNLPIILEITKNLQQTSKLSGLLGWLFHLVAVESC